MSTTLKAAELNGTATVADTGDGATPASAYQSSLTAARYTLAEGGSAPKYVIPANLSQANPKSSKPARRSPPPLQA